MVSSWIDEAINRSFLSFAFPPIKPTEEAISPGPPPDCQFRERFLRDLAGIDHPQIQVKADLGKEMEVIDGGGNCFYVPADRLWQP